MDIAFDPAKNARNIEVHGVSLGRATEFDWVTALHIDDTRHDYGERRIRALGLIGSRLHVLVNTPRESRMHVISLRKANKREVRSHGRQTKEEENSNGS